MKAAGAVARRYARALLAVAVERGEELEGLDAELAELARVLEGDPKLRETLSSPALPVAKSRAVVDALVGELRPSPLVANLLRVMAGHRRLPLLGAVREQFRKAVDEHLGIVSGEVVSAQPLAEDERRAVRSRLEEITGKRMRLDFRTDPTIVGGLVVRLGNRIYDASVVAQLEAFKRRALATA